MSKQYVAQMQHQKMVKINKEFEDQFGKMNEMYQVQIQKYSSLFDELKKNYILKIKDYEGKFQLNEKKMNDLSLELEGIKQNDGQEGKIESKSSSQQKFQSVIEKEIDLEKKLQEYQVLKTNLDEFSKQVDMKNDFAKQVLSKKEEIIEKMMTTCKIKEEESQNLRELCDKMEQIIKKHTQERALQLKKNTNLKSQLEDYIKIIQMLDKENKEGEQQTEKEGEEKEEKEENEEKKEEEEKEEKEEKEQKDEEQIVEK